MQPYNIVIFNPDQFRADALGHMGNAAAYTPVLDRFAREEGVSFRTAVCQNPVCTPSRCSFMSGWYPHVAGHRTMYHMMQPNEPVLLKTLKDNGYYVWWGGKNDLVPGQNSLEPYCSYHNGTNGKKLSPNPHGFDSWRGEKGGKNYYSFYAGEEPATEPDGDAYGSDLHNVLSACDFLDARAGQEDAQPFCLYLPLGAPHPPYYCERKWIDKIDRSKLPKRIPTPQEWEGLPSILRGIWEGQNLQSLTQEDWDDIRVTYLAMCARIDHQFGLILDALKRTGVYDRTAIFFLSDHGDFTGDYGLVEKTQNTFEDCLVRVPFLVKPPADFAVQPRISEALVELIDMPATIEAITGIAPRHTHFGRSLLPVLAGETDEHRDAVFCEGGRLHGETQCMERESTAAGDRSLYWPRLKLQIDDTKPYHTKAVMCRTKEYKYVRRLYERDELYDLAEDPMELHNRIDDPALAQVRAQLCDRLCTFYLETSDVVPFETDQR